MSKKGDVTTPTPRPDVQAAPVMLAQDEYLRLCCLHMVVVTGAETDRENPVPKAQMLFEYVKGGQQKSENKTEE